MAVRNSGAKAVVGHSDDDATRVLTVTRAYLDAVDELMQKHDTALSLFNAMKGRQRETCWSLTKRRRYGRSVCTYAFVHYKLHYVCVSCRISFKRHPSNAGHTCPRCAGTLLCAGHDFAAPRRSNRKAWSVVSVVLAAGLRYEGFEPCGCGREPKFRPRTRAQVRARRVIAARTGTPLTELLGRADPLEQIR